MQAGALTVGNKIDVNRLIGVLNEIVVTEIVCYLRYSQHAIAATGLDHAQVAAAFEEHADEDLQHGMWAAERVSRLGRDPDFNSATLKECSHTEYVMVDDADLTPILKELGRRRIAITTYEIGRWMDGPLGYLTGRPGPGTFAASSAGQRSCCAASVHSPFGLAGRIGRRQLLLPVRFP